MGRPRRIMSLFVLVVLAASLAGCAGSRTLESTGENVDDSLITAKIKAAIAQDPSLRAFQINVETFKGVVLLSGFVDSADAVSRATTLASRVAGVKSVKNSLIVKKQ